ncbi:hypothetical protein B9Z55_027485 [Caenorhabditis nigoni]|uniref:Ubiquitin-like domain-containing protein n=1 Tax=Caenorhabditis nigoni TaxID=1611254 RepID=A0A2G5SFN6_9PELO|nr:hypothetical protein B9Z55_027485 [Caenorhabditis nigoni]
MSTLILATLIEYVEPTTIFAVVVLIVCGFISYQISSRRPLYYNLFVVEMHTWTSRRMVQVLHLGQEFTPPVTWDRLVQRMRARAPRIQGENRIAISDTNIVIQSPNTVIDSPAPARSPDVDLITLWDIEMPPPSAGHVPDATRDSQYAAAAAIAILARGDDASLMSRVFRNQERMTRGDAGIAPTLEERMNPRHDYVTTDVTYTTPSINPDLRHQISTTTSNVTAPREAQHDNLEPEIVVIDDMETSSENGMDEEEEEEEEVDADEVDADDSGLSVNAPIEETEEERERKAERDAEMSVLEGPSEGKILIRLKFLSDTEKDTYASLQDTVAKFKVEHFTDLSNKVIRLIFQGQLLREDSRTLESYGLQAGSVMHCHISIIPLSRPGVANMTPIVHDSEPRRRIRRSQRTLRDPTPIPLEGIQNALDRAIQEQLARNRAAQDRNVGQIYLLLSTMVPILSGIGLAFFRPDRIRDLLRPATLLTISQWVCNLLVDNGLLEQENEEQEQQREEVQQTHLQTSTLFYIFGGQMIAVSIFLYYFPDVFDRVGFSIFVIVFLYFVFVVYSRQRRRRPTRSQAQNEIMIEDQIVQETISLL